MARITEDPYVFKVLDVSMEHISQQDAEKLGRSEFPGCAIPYDEGVTVIVSYDKDQYDAMLYYGMSLGFLRIWNMARKHEAQEIRIDRDGTLYEDLETYEW